jgi:hypothetical protein
MEVKDSKIITMVQIVDRIITQPVTSEADYHKKMGQIEHMERWYDLEEERLRKEMGEA